MRNIFKRIDNFYDNHKWFRIVFKVFEIIVFYTILMLAILGLLVLKYYPIMNNNDNNVNIEYDLSNNTQQVFQDGNVNTDISWVEEGSQTPVKLQNTNLYFRRVSLNSWNNNTGISRSFSNAIDMIDTKTSMVGSRTWIYNPSSDILFFIGNSYNIGGVGTLIPLDGFYMDYNGSNGVHILSLIIRGNGITIITSENEEYSYSKADLSNNSYFFIGNRPNYNDGFDDGYQDGYSDGSSDGFDDGYDYGYDYGFDDGFDDGYQDGYSDGSSDGFDDGYDYGFEQGLKDSVYNQPYVFNFNNPLPSDLHNGTLGSFNNHTDIKLLYNTLDFSLKDSYFFLLPNFLNENNISVNYNYRFLAHDGTDYDIYTSFFNIFYMKINQNNTIDLIGVRYVNGLAQAQLETIFTVDLSNSVFNNGLYLLRYRAFTDDVSEWYYQGLLEGYDNGFDDGYGEGTINGKTIGYNQGYNEGLNANPNNHWSDLLFTIFGAFGTILAIEILPGWSIGIIIGIPIVFGIIYFIIGRKKD